MKRARFAFLVTVALAPGTARAAAQCWTIADPDQRALCLATQTRSVGPCSFIEDQALRATCRARVTMRPSPCDTIAGAWEREQCKREAKAHQ